jgi:hypothetical protein
VRRDLATVLRLMGFDNPIDFDVAADAAGEVSITTWRSAIPQPSEAQIAAFDVNLAVVQKARTLAQILVDKADADRDVFRAGLLTTLDALNRQSRQFRDLLAAIAAATNLANLQTRAAAIAPVEPARTPQELKDAVKAKIAAGDAD